MLILIASGSILVSYFVASATPIGKASAEPVEIETIERIERTVATPDPRVFNQQAINPSVEVNIESSPELAPDTAQ